jgi:hypothetical protein
MQYIRSDVLKTVYTGRRKGLQALRGNSTRKKEPVRVLSRVWMTIDDVCIRDWIYWTLWYSAWLHFTVHSSVHSQCFTSRRLVAASNGGRFTSSGILNCPRSQLAASHSNSSQRLNLSSSLMNLLTNLSTHRPTNSSQLNWLLELLPNCPAYNISARPAQKTLCCNIWAVV